MEFSVADSPTVRQCSTRRLIAAFLVLIGLLATACGSPSQSRNVGSPSESPAEADLSVGRTAAAPASDGSLDTNADGNLDPTAATTNQNVVHVLGSVRSTPVETDVWQEEVPIVGSDLATVASVNCNLADDCDLNTIADWAEGRVDVINLATSASVLTADELLELTDILEARGVAVVGFGPDQSSAERPFTFVNQDLTVSIHALSVVAVPEVQATGETAGIAGPESLDAVLDAVAVSRDAEQGVVVLLDWGGLEERAPSTNETDIVERLIGAGANAVIGHGPDFLQRFDQVGGGVAAYSLGNAVSAVDEPVRRDTAVLRLEFARPGRSCLLPATATSQGPTLDDLGLLTCAR